MKKIILLTLFGLLLTGLHAQLPDMGGTITCQLGGKEWKGKLKIGTYNKTADLIDLQFSGLGNDSLSELNIHIKGIKQYMVPYPEYTNEFEFDYSAMTYSDEYILISYLPDRNARLREYKPLYTGIHIQEVNLDQPTIRFECMGEMGIMKEHADKSKTIMENLDKIELSEGQTDKLKIIAY